MSRPEEQQQTEDLERDGTTDPDMTNPERQHSDQGNETAGDSIRDQDSLVVLEARLAETTDKYLRLYAEFENYKKRSVREKLDWMKTASQDTMSALLPVLDDFDRARKFSKENDGQGWSEGVDLVYQKLFTILRAKGLEQMQTEGMAFDPELHEAITEIPVTAPEQKGKVIDTIEQGYRLNDKIIRHAKVVVGK